MTRHAVDWRGYLDRFHAERPGITEEVLARSWDRGQNPYQWIVDAIPERTNVLDLACGSAPLFEAMRGRWIGVDRSAGELRLAAERGATPLALGDATAVPLAAERFDAVVCSMGLMLLQPLEAALGEIARVLRPGGHLVALMPTTRPLRLSDRYRYARLLAALRTAGLQYPNDHHLARPAEPLERADLRLLSDERRRFSCSLDTPEIAGRFVRSLYLPNRAPEQLSAAIAVAQRWVGKAIGIPIRRLIAQR